MIADLTTTQTCVECGKELLQSDFQYNARAHTTMNVCKACMGARIRAGQLTGEAKNAAVEPEPEPEPAWEPAFSEELPVELTPVTCPGHVRVCGDGLIARELPGFFETHERAPLGSEWQVCRLCRDAKLVQVYDPGELGEWKPEPEPLPEPEKAQEPLSPVPLAPQPQWLPLTDKRLVTLEELNRVLHERFMSLQQEYDEVCEERERLLKINGELGERLDNLLADNARLRRVVVMVHKERELAEAERLVANLVAEIARLEAEGGEP